MMFVYHYRSIGKILYDNTGVISNSLLNNSIEKTTFGVLLSFYLGKVIDCI